MSKTDTPLLDSLMARLTDHCRQRGQKTELIKELKISAPMLSAWLKRIKSPGGEYTLAIQKWLDEKEQ